MDQILKTSSDVSLTVTCKSSTPSHNEAMALSSVAWASCMLCICDTSPVLLLVWLCSLSSGIYEVLVRLRLSLSSFLDTAEENLKCTMNQKWTPYWRTLTLNELWRITEEYRHLFLAIRTKASDFSFRRASKASRVFSVFSLLSDDKWLKSWNHGCSKAFAAVMRRNGSTCS